MRRLQRLRSVRKDGSHNAPSHEEWAHRKCGWKHSAKDEEPLHSTTKGAATSALTNCAFSWKFAYAPADRGF